MNDRDAEKEPPALPAEAHALLLAYRDDEAMPPATIRRVWHEIRADPAAPVREGGTARRVGLWLGGGLAAAAVILLATRWGTPSTAERVGDPALHAAPDRAIDRDTDGDASPRTGARDRGSRDRSARDAGIEAADAEPSGAAGRSDAAATSGAAAPSEAAAAVEMLAPAPTEPARPPGHSPRGSKDRARPGPSHAAADSPAAAPAFDLAAERELIAAAWRALAKGSASQARAHAEAHARRFPDGMLAPEREAVRAIAECRAASAPRPELAEAFERAHPRSALRERVREACDPPAP